MSVGNPGADARQESGWGPLRRSVAAIVAASCALSVMLLLDLWPTLRGIGWRWDYVPPTAALAARMAPAIVVLTVYGAGLVVLRRSPDWLLIVWSVLGGVSVPVSLLHLIGDPLFVLFSRTVSQYATGGFAASLGVIDPHRTLAEWPAWMANSRESLPHMAISSPAWTLIYDAVARLLALAPALSARLALPLIPLVCQSFRFLHMEDSRIASTWLGIASPLWAALTAVPIYALGRQIAGRRPARHAVAWWPLVPALALFAATLNTAYPLFTTAALALYVSSLRDSRSWLGHALRLLVGLLLGLLVLWNFSLIPLLLFCGILTLVWWRPGWRDRRSRGLRWLLLVGAEVTAGLLLVWIPYTLVASHSPLDLLVSSMQVHLRIERPYLPWLGLHAWDLVLFTGLPICALAVLGPIVNRREVIYRRFAITLGLTLLILLLSGTARGETGRVWIFFIPLITLLAAGALASLDLTARVVLTGAQVLWLLTVATVLRTIITADVPQPPSYQDVAVQPLRQPVVPVQADFDHKLELVGYQAFYEPATRSITLATHWRPLQQMRRPYYLSAVLVSPSGEVAPGVSWQPFDTRYPTTCWASGKPREGSVVDQVDLPLGAAPPSGDWWLSFSVLELPEDGPPTVLPVNRPDGQRDVQVGLGPVTVSAAR